MKYHTKEKAFTLAEVLITLGIIGIVAAMTMPALIVSHKEKETSVKLKKVYSTLSQAYISATNKYEAPENWNWAPAGSVSASDMILDYFAEYLVVSKRCTNSPKCLPDVMYKRLNGTNHSNYHNEGTGSTLILNDGQQFIYGLVVYVQLLHLIVDLFLLILTEKQDLINSVVTFSGLFYHLLL